MGGKTTDQMLAAWSVVRFYICFSFMYVFMAGGTYKVNFSNKRLGSSSTRAIEQYVSCKNCSFVI
ncbi:hypothetical protein HNO89_003587 [Sporosarcina luteola]|nr:hypothetical protein [Sporosarcina luteola]